MRARSTGFQKESDENGYCLIIQPKCVGRNTIKRSIRKA